MSFKVYLDESPELRVKLDEEIRIGDKVVRPLTVTENGVYTGGEEDGKQVTYSPVTVDIPLDKKAAMRALVALRSNHCESLFHGAGWTDEEAKEWIEYDLLKYANSNNIVLTSLYHSNAKITEAPLIDISYASNVSMLFYSCFALKKVPAFDFRRLTSLSNMFMYSSKLEEIYVKNIKANLQVGSGTQWGHLLTLESLIHLIGELRNTGTLLTFTVGSANLEKLANIYVKTVEITDEMRANDDLIDEKLPFEVCESTEAGAMLITEYVRFKNWTIQ